MKAFTIAVAAIFAAASVAADAPAATGVEAPAQTPQLNSPTVQGCFSSAGGLKYKSIIQFNTIGTCSAACLADQKDVSATTGGNQCWCGDDYPPANTIVDDSECNIGCSGFDPQACGGLKTFTVYNNGRNLTVVNLPNVTHTSSTVSSAGSSATSPAAVVTYTQTSAASAAPGGGGGGSNVASIAAGVVVGVVVVMGIVGGIFFMMRRRRNMEIESSHRRNQAVNAFIGGSKPPSSSGGFSMSDQRLDPVMAQRRMSSGSIADNQDYSRRILRVTNA